MDIEKAKAAKEILDSIEKIREFRSFYEKNRLRQGEENIQRLIRYILNGCDVEIKDLENQIGRM